MPLHWFVHAGTKQYVTSNIDNNNVTFATLQGNLLAKLKGTADLGKMGPWDVTFKVQKSAGSPATDFINVKINGRQLGNTDQARGFHLETRSGHVAFEFEWETN